MTFKFKSIQGEFMKIFALILLLSTLNAHAFTETYKGYGKSIDLSEDRARSMAIHSAIRDAKKLARYACWSRQGKGKLCGEFMIEVISRDLIDGFEAQATALGTFVCHQDDNCPGN